MTIRTRLILAGILLTICLLVCAPLFGARVFANFAIVIGLLLLVMLGMRLWSRYLPAKITVTQSGITYKNLFSKKQIHLSDGVVGFLGVYVYPGAAFTDNLLFIKDTKTGETIKLNGAYWEVEDLEAIALATKIDMYNPLEKTLTLDFVNKKYPQLFRFRERHSGAYVVIIFLTCIVLLAALAVIAGFAAAYLA